MRFSMQSDEDTSPYAGLGKKIRGGKSASAIEFENRPPALTVIRTIIEERPRGTLAILGLFQRYVSSFPFSVELDGQVLGALSVGDVITVDIAPGSHSLQITTPISKSKARQLQAENGQRIRFLCQPTVTGIDLREVEFTSL
jgi:hypothetical protein